MKILVLADVHSNWQALSAVARNETFDACVIAGDLVDYGVQPAECIAWARDNHAICIRGNHDHAVAQHVPVKRGSGFKKLAAFARPLHWDTLNATDMTWLARVPVSRYVTIGDNSFYLVHGTPRDPLDEYLTNNAEAWKLRMQDMSADYVCVGHTHLPIRVDLDGMTIINPGSVGQPRDGDPRASYVVIEDGRIKLRRIPYDIDENLKRLRERGPSDEVYAIAESVLTTGGRMPNAT